jgi:hypothetical protein
MRRVLALVCAVNVAITLSFPSRSRAAGADEGRKHVSKAAELAADGKCAAAVPEFTQAYAILKDPVILFNRAECLRMLGKGEEALVDYRRFLTDLPRAPNRKLVEKRIAALEPAEAPPAEPPPSPVPSAAPESADESPADILRARPVRQPRSSPPMFIPRWAWIGMGAVVLAAGAAGLYFARRDKTEIPASSLGGVRF